MSRGVASSNITAASADELQPVLLYEAEFDSGITRAWNGLGDLTAFSNTFTGVGNLISVSPIEETYEVKATGFTVTLDGILADNVTDALTEDYQNRTLTVYLGFLSGGSLISDPLILAKGFMDVMTISEGGDTSSISVTCETRLIDFERPRKYTYTAEDQKAIYPSDKGFDFVSAIQDKEITWGMKPRPE